MCRDLPAIHDARAAWVKNTRKAVCVRRLKNGETLACAFAAVCGTERQRLKRADLWIVPHDCLFQEKPACVDEPAVLVIDESCWGSSIDTDSELSIDTLAQLKRLPDPGDTERYQYLLDGALSVVRKLEQDDYYGPFPSASAKASRLTPRKLPRQPSSCGR